MLVGGRKFQEGVRLEQHGWYARPQAWRVEMRGSHHSNRWVGSDWGHISPCGHRPAEGGEEISLQELWAEGGRCGGPSDYAGDLGPHPGGIGCGNG